MSSFVLNRGRAVFVVCLGILPSVAAWGREPTPALADDAMVAIVDERLNQWRLKLSEKRFDEIGWAANLLEARRLAEKHRRPLFLFTMDGRVNTGRC